MTDILAKRIYEHKLGLVEGFTKKYNVNTLVYFETQPDIASAINREKQLKNWHRQWKINLIEEKNKDWRDLYPEIADPVKSLYSDLP